jgi:adenylate cyclase
VAEGEPPPEGKGGRLPDELVQAAERLLPEQLGVPDLSVPAGRAARAAAAIRATNRRPGLVRALRTARELLPGDEHFGDNPVAGDDRPAAVIARFLAERPAFRPAAGAEEDRERDGEAVTATREVAMAGLQLWQVVSEGIGRGAGTVQATVLFTDLVGFSGWVLQAGDELALELLRAVATVVEPAITAHGGRVVKRLGDGHMAVFPSARGGLEAGLDMQAGLQVVEIGGYRPRMRVGLHTGQPRRMNGDYLGTDVNIAARVCEAAGAGEVLVSGPVLAAIPEEEMEGLRIKRRRGFRAKGTPPGLEVFHLERKA